MTTATESLRQYLFTPDPYATPSTDLLPAQLQAAQERFDACREQIPVLRERAKELNVDRVDSLDDLLPLLFAHGVYKTYPDSFIANGQWDRMNAWLDTLSSASTQGIDLSGVETMDDWLGALHRTGHPAVVSSGTTGKCSIFNQAPSDRTYLPLAFKQFFSWRGERIGERNRPVVVTHPHKGPTRFTDGLESVVESFGRPGAIHYLTQDPLSADFLNEVGRMRKSIADGTAMASEIASFQMRAAAREAAMSAEFDVLADKIIQHLDEPTFFFGLIPLYWRVMEILKKKGLSGGEFHPATTLLLLGGTKGTDLPPDYLEQLMHFYNQDLSRVLQVYGMNECSTPFGACSAGQYHCPPWIILLLVDPSGEVLLNESEGEVEGRLAFFDTLVEGRWGGNISGDKVTVDFSICRCGNPGPAIRPNIVRYVDLPEGDDKLTCAGSADVYARGVMVTEL